MYGALLLDWGRVQGSEPRCRKKSRPPSSPARTRWQVSSVGTERGYGNRCDSISLTSSVGWSCTDSEPTGRNVRTPGCQRGRSSLGTPCHHDMTSSAISPRKTAQPTRQRVGNEHVVQRQHKSQTSWNGSLRSADTLSGSALGETGAGAGIRPKNM